MTETFRDVYERHVGRVVKGDMAGAMADMHPGRLRTVFDGVTVPTAKVESGEIRSFRAGDAEAVGEAVYTLADGAIGLRSFWVLESGRWLAARLENFEVERPAK